jgi:hypothetical protein
MKKYAGNDESLVNEGEPEITPKRVDLFSIRPKDSDYEDTGRMSDLSTKVMSNEGVQKMEPAPSTPKPKIVTKEELAKSGLTLREYMNQQQGLNPRGESAPSKAAPKSEPVSVTKEKTTVSALPRGQAKALDRVGNKITEEGLARMRAKDEAFRNAPSPLDNIKSLGKKLREKAGITSYKKGGMTASNRGDGIAQRGKTRGKMC